MMRKLIKFTRIVFLELFRYANSLFLELTTMTLSLKKAWQYLLSNNKHFQSALPLKFKKKLSNDCVKTRGKLKDIEYNIQWLKG